MLQPAVEWERHVHVPDYSTTTTRMTVTGLPVKAIVYDATGFMDKRPGGKTAIALCWGQGATGNLAAMAHLSNPGLRSLSETYRIGTLQKPRHAEELYTAAFRLGEKAAETENVARTSLQLLNGCMTSLDKRGEITVHKARHLAESRWKLCDWGVVTLVALVEGVLGKAVSSVSTCALRLRIAPEWAISHQKCMRGGAVGAGGKGRSGILSSYCHRIQHSG